jgi:AraC-like DNA-binding protein
MRLTPRHDDTSTVAVDIRGPGPVESFEFATRDRDMAYDFLTRAYANYHQRLAAPKKTYLLQLTRTSGGSFWIDTVRHTARSRYKVAPLGCVLVYRVISGRLEREAKGTVERLGPGAVGVTADPHDAYDGYLEDVSTQLVGLQLPILAQVAARDPDDHGASVRFTGLLPVSAAVALHWESAVKYAGTVLNNPEAAASPLLLGTTARTLAAAALTAFPNTTWDEDAAAREHTKPAPDRVRLAVAYIDTHAGEDLTLLDIARAVSITPRALQYAFRRHLETTPLGYVRLVRLDRAHTDLLNADPTRGDTVGGIAMRWGFLHQGNFAAAYREAYGTTPRQTLRS